MPKIVIQAISPTMNILPVESYTLHLSLSPSKVHQILSEQCEAPRIRFGFSRNHPPFQGTCSETEFQFSRIIHYRNSFLPIIRGKIQETDIGSMIHIQMSPHPFVMVFTMLWCLGWFSFIFVFLLSGSFPMQGLFFFIGLPMIVFGAFFLAFKFEVKKARAILNQLLSNYRIE